MNLSWRVTENNGGGLGLWVWDNNNTLIFAHNGYEYNDGQLTEDINYLQADDSVDGWDGNEITDEDTVRAVRNNNYEPEEMEAMDYTGIAPDNLIFNGDGNIIPLTTAEYYDDHSETKVIHDSDCGMADCEDMGRAGQDEFYPEKSVC